MLLFPKTAVRWHWPRDLISEPPLDGRPNSSDVAIMIRVSFLQFTLAAPRVR